MSRTSLIDILVFAAGLGSGYFSRSAAGMLQRRTKPHPWQPSRN